MSRFVRRGTVSKSSGPIHLDSYALKGVPIRYTPPIYLPDLILLPPGWKPPLLPTRESLYYDYSVEKKVLDQAKHRAVSIAAEASLQMKEIRRLREAHQLVESQGDESDESVENSLPVQQPMPRPPIIPGSDILTPTPVVAVNNTSQSGSKSDETGQTGAAGIESDGKAKMKTSDDTLKSLGQLSIREFEGDISDPFEITSLQAINDMEILQTVLQPTAPPTTIAGGPLPTVAPLHSTTNSPQTSQVPPALSTAGQCSSPTGLTRNTNSSGHLSSLAQPVSSVQHVPSQQSNSTVVSPSLPVQVPLRASSSPSVGGVASGSSPSNPFLSGPIVTAPPTQPVTVNPFFQAPPPSSVAPSFSSTNPFHATSPPAVGPPPLAIGPSPSTGAPPPVLGPSPSGIPPLQASGFAPLVDLGTTIHQPIPPLHQPAASPSVPPVPKPRTAVPPPHVSTPPTTTIPVSSHQRNPVFPTAQQGRFGLGVPVLPPITGPSPSSPGSSHQPSSAAGPPPPYKVKPSPPTQHKEAPPAYSSARSKPSPKERRPNPPPATAAPPPVIPRTYKLPDPTAKLTHDQQSELKSISGMGFPSPRVARALVKCEGDRTKVFDFLFLVGRLEEEGYSGDSAETALLACNEKPEEAVEYLKKVESYRSMGFSENRIHEAHVKAKGDWDKALDILIQGR